MISYFAKIINILQILKGGVNFWPQLYINNNLRQIQCNLMENYASAVVHLHLCI